MVTLSSPYCLKLRQQFLQYCRKKIWYWFWSHLVANNLHWCVFLCASVTWNSLYFKAFFQILIYFFFYFVVEFKLLLILRMFDSTISISHRKTLCSNFIGRLLLTTSWLAKYSCSLIELPNASMLCNRTFYYA